MSPSTRGCGLKCFTASWVILVMSSPSTRGCGFKCRRRRHDSRRLGVTLHARVWIEISDRDKSQQAISSPSTRGCGLKCPVQPDYAAHQMVTLHARVWIEISCLLCLLTLYRVTLHARVWIEILRYFTASPRISVTLHARVWIEIACCRCWRRSCPSHPPREGVD